ncbi:MAG TPA: APC family permease [Acidothermaceae bacterium]|nr:APC family permease [Acidothermaceae bacterium]
MSTSVGSVKRLFVGRPLRSQQLHETLLPKWLALPIFASDPISSVAYATEEIVLVLAVGGGAAALTYAKNVAAAVALLLVIVTLSYRQICRAYPNGGGAFAVSLDNFGENAALTAGSALLVDYVMTVAVSVVSGVVAITSAFPSLHRHAVALSVGFVVLLMVANLRGVKESGRAFAVPTYSFIGLTYIMFIVAAVKASGNGLPRASTASQTFTHSHLAGLALILLTLKAFASGCTALTGVEAISNGVPSFRKPKSRNAAKTLTAMGTLAVTMFIGITVLALHVKAHAQPSGNPSVISQIAAVVFGKTNVLFYLYQAATAGILILAANTAFNGFPVLSSILAQHSYLPRQLQKRGDKLVFSNGILLLGGFAIALIIGFDANIDKLIQLYIIGVFTSFTLSQSGMVKHWKNELRDAPRSDRRRIRTSRVINFTGAVATAVVLGIVLYAKVPDGAWIAIVAMVLLFALMKGIRRHYTAVSKELDIETAESPTTMPSRNHAVVLVSRLHLPALRALAYAKATRPTTIEAVTINADEAEAKTLQEQWQARGIDVPLVLLDSPYREVTRPLLEYIRGRRGQSPRDVVTVFIPEYVVGHWWEQLLHNQSALRLKARLLFEPGVMVTSVPWQLHSTDRLRAESTTTPE